MESEGFKQAVLKEKTQEPPNKTLKLPRRASSVVIPEKKPKLTIPVETYPKEESYIKNKQLRECLQTPLTLYELAAMVVDSLPLPRAFNWSVNKVANWMAEELVLPQYKECFFDNHIDGKRLLILEDPSRLAELNIKDFEHIKKITAKIHELYSTEFIKFTRSISLPPRKPLTHCIWFKSRTGPSWGIRKNWTRCDILRWMKIMPEPFHWNHWDLVWYQKPEFPIVKFSRTLKAISEVFIPTYVPQLEPCREYMVPRKFKFQSGIPEAGQFIWIEERPKPKKPEPRLKPKPIESRLIPKKVNLKGLTGKDLILGRRKLGKPKFLA